MRTHVSIPDTIIERIDRLVGPRRRSQFLAEAADEKLHREEMLAALAAAIRSMDDGGYPPEWDTSESAAAWVRSLRDNLRDPWAESRDRDIDAP